MRVLLLGSNGFVGRHFAKRLLDDGHTVVGVDNLSSGIELYDWMFKPNGWSDKTRSVPNLQLMISDVRAWFPAAGPGSLWSAIHYDLIIHCAAVVGGRIKIENDPLAVATDLAIDADFFNWLAACKTKAKIIYFSSSAVYPLELQTREAHCLLHEALVDLNTRRFGKPDMTYGWAKLSGEYLAKFAVENYGLDVAIYRPFGGYGEDQDARAYPFPAIIQRVANGENPIQIWGSGEQTRDFIHVSDVVSCVLDTYEKLSSKVLNIGTGIGTSFFSLAEQIVTAAGGDATVINVPNRPEGVFARVCDPHQMSKLYAPKVTLEEGIKRVLDATKKKA